MFHEIEPRGPKGSGWTRCVVHPSSWSGPYSIWSGSPWWVVGGSWLLLGSNGDFLLPVLFRGGINSVMQVVAAKSAYKPIYAWQKVLDGYSETYEIRFLVRQLDNMGIIPSHDTIPDKVMKAPQPYSPAAGFPVRGDRGRSASPERRFRFGGRNRLPAHAETPYICVLGMPARYWYGRPVFIPDENHKLHLRSACLLSSSSFFGAWALFQRTRCVIHHRHGSRSVRFCGGGHSSCILPDLWSASLETRSRLRSGIMLCLSTSLPSVLCTCLGEMKSSAWAMRWTACPASSCARCLASAGSFGRLPTSWARPSPA